MYVVKEYDERKTEFLDTAMRLFMEHGYEETTVNAIIDAVGVSKGAFYHYFRTKEDLLDELAKRTGDQALELVTPLVDDVTLDATEKLNEMFHRTNALKAANRDLMMTLAEVFYGDANILLRNRLAGRTIETVAPVFASIIEQGNREGTMSVRYPEETARFTLRIGGELVADFARAFPRIAHDPEAAEGLVRLMEVYTESVERILGIESGRLRLVDESMMELIRGA
jgi:AcrR family transcriptional regulator